MLLAAACGGGRTPAADADGADAVGGEDAAARAGHDPVSIRPRLDSTPSRFDPEILRSGQSAGTGGFFSAFDGDAAGDAVRRTVRFAGFARSSAKVEVGPSVTVRSTVLVR